MNTFQNSYPSAIFCSFCFLFLLLQIQSTNGLFVWKHFCACGCCLSSLSACVVLEYTTLTPFPFNKGVPWNIYTSVVVFFFQYRQKRKFLEVRRILPIPRLINIFSRHFKASSQIGIVQN